MTLCALVAPQVASEATGVGHVLNNKGGIAVAVEYWDTSLGFVCFSFPLPLHAYNVLHSLACPNSFFPRPEREYP